MKRLLIVRHAKSSWEFSQLSDFERPLNARGERDAPYMAQRFLALGIIPDLIISSPATRALTTAQVFAQILRIPSEEIVLDEDHYHASSDTLRALIREFPNEHDCIMIFGHNPGLTYLINEVSHLRLDNLPTCGVCGIEFQLDNWREVKKGSGKNFYYDFPKKS